MGKLLGQTQAQENELGVLPAVIGGAAGPLAYLGIKNIFGGSGCSGSDKQKRKQIAKLINEHLSYSDRRQLVRIAKSDISPTPKDMAYFMVGGKDCLHKNVSPGDKRFLKEVPKRIKQRMQEKQQKQNVLRQQKQQQTTGSGSKDQQLPSDSNNQNESQPPSNQAQSQAESQQQPSNQGIIPGMSKNMSYVTIGGVSLLVLGTAVALSN